MKNLKQIREGYDLITEKEEAEDRRLNALVRAGLYDAKKLPALKKALDKNADKTTPQEKRMLINLLDMLLSQVLSNQQVYMKVKQNVQHDIKEAARPDYLSKSDPRFGNKWPSDRDIPTVLILKRKAIRVYPDNQKVALYYSQALDKYVTIPFSDVQFAVNEESYADLYSDNEKSPAPSNKKDKSKKDKSKDISLRASSAANMLRQGKVTYKKTYMKKDSEGNPTQGTIDYSKLNKNKTGSLADYANKIGGPHPMIGAVGAKIHDTIKGIMRKKRLNKALAIRAAKRKATTTEESQPIKSVGSVMNQSPSQSLVSENFQIRVKQIREEREQIDEVLPAIIAGAARVALPAIARGAARYAPAIGRGLSKLKDKIKDKVLNSTKKIDDTKTISKDGKITDAGRLARREKAAERLSRIKNSRKPGWGRKALRAGRRGLGGLGALAAASGDSDNSRSQSSKPSYKMDRNSGDYQFNLKPTTSSSFDTRRQGADAIAARDAQLSRKANQAILKENVIDTIKNMVKNDISESTLAYNEREITINNTVAKKLLSIYESMNRENRKKMEDMLNESAVGFNKILTFAIRH